MQRQVGVSPVIIISALLIGGSLLGIVGAVLAIPTAAILQVVFQAVVNGRDS
jgi:predicted PurR-regulated permease PerM